MSKLLSPIRFTPGRSRAFIRGVTLSHDEQLDDRKSVKSDLPLILRQLRYRDKMDRYSLILKNEFWNIGLEGEIRINQSELIKSGLRYRVDLLHDDSWLFEPNHKHVVIRDQGFSKSASQARSDSKDWLIYKPQGKKNFKLGEAILRSKQLRLVHLVWDTSLMWRRWHFKLQPKIELSMFRSDREGVYLHDSNVVLRPEEFVDVQPAYLITWGFRWLHPNQLYYREIDRIDRSDIPFKRWWVKWVAREYDVRGLGFTIDCDVDLQVSTPKETSLSDDYKAIMGTKYLLRTITDADRSIRNLSWYTLTGVIPTLRYLLSIEGRIFKFSIEIRSTELARQGLYIQPILKWKVGRDNFFYSWI